MGAARFRGRSVTSDISLEGAVVGIGAAAEIMELIGGDVLKVEDGRSRRFRMGKAR